MNTKSNAAEKRMVMLHKLRNSEHLSDREKLSVVFHATMVEFCIRRQNRWIRRQNKHGQHVLNAVHLHNLKSDLEKL